jgi:hypothetical protein
MATLALRIVDNDIPGIQITLADTQVKTVLGGFAGVGGLWTILNGVFAILFGGSFIYNIFGGSLADLLRRINTGIRRKQTSQCIWITALFPTE